MFKKDKKTIKHIVDTIMYDLVLFVWGIDLEFFSVGNIRLRSFTARFNQRIFSRCLYKTNISAFLLVSIANLRSDDENKVRPSDFRKQIFDTDLKPLWWNEKPFEHCMHNGPKKQTK